MLSNHLTKHNFVATITVVLKFIEKRCGCCEVRCLGFFLIFFSLSVKDFQNVLRLQQVITLGHSIAFQCNLVNEHITLSLTSCSQKIYDSFFSFLHSFGFSEKWNFADYKTSKSGGFGFKYLIKHRNWQGTYYFKA